MEYTADEVRDGVWAYAAHICRGRPPVKCDVEGECVMLTLKRVDDPTEVERQILTLLPRGYYLYLDWES